MSIPEMPFRGVLRRNGGGRRSGRWIALGIPCITSPKVARLSVVGQPLRPCARRAPGSNRARSDRRSRRGAERSRPAIEGSRAWPTSPCPRREEPRAPRARPRWSPSASSSRGSSASCVSACRRISSERARPPTSSSPPSASETSRRTFLGGRHPVGGVVHFRSAREAPRREPSERGDAFRARRAWSLDARRLDRVGGRGHLRALALVAHRGGLRRRATREHDARGAGRLSYDGSARAVGLGARGLERASPLLLAVRRARPLEPRADWRPLPLRFAPPRARRKPRDDPRVERALVGAALQLPLALARGARAPRRPSPAARREGPSRARGREALARRAHRPRRHSSFPGLVDTLLVELPRARREARHSATRRPFISCR